MDHRLDPFGPSTPTHGRAGGITRRRDLPQTMGQMLMILAAVHGLDTSPNVPEEDPGRAAHDLRPAESPPEAPTQGVVEGDGVVTGDSPDTPPEEVSDVGHVGNDADDAVQPARSGGRCAHRYNVLFSLTTSTCRERLEGQGNWRSSARIRCCQSCRRSVWSPQGCARSRLHRLRSIQGSFVAPIVKRFC